MGSERREERERERERKRGRARAREKEMKRESARAGKYKAGMSAFKANT